MQGSLNTESLEETARRQANFLVLRSLEAKLSPSLFREVVDQMGSSSDLPKRITWTGDQRDLTFEEAKVNYAQLDQRYLPKLVGCSLNNFKQQKSSFAKLNSFESKQDVDRTRTAAIFPKNSLLRLRGMDSSGNQSDVVPNLQVEEVSRFARMKTVLAHAQIDDGYQAPVYNVKFDQSGQFIISGGDDGIIKIWDRDTMNLQGSLHSHMEVIADLDVSLCNKYLVSSSQDGKIIVWDWRTCQKVDTINDHTANVNNVKFFKLFPTLDDEPPGAYQMPLSKGVQLLISCSEDGTVKIYDEISYLETKDSNHKPSKKSSKPKNAANQAKFQLTLVPDDYRQGARNKKIYTVNVSKDGIVAAGSDKGDVFMWQLDFTCLKRQREQGAAKFLGTFKKHQKTVFYCEFSPDGKMLFTGSDDGTAKIWKIDEKNPAIGDEKLLETLEHKIFIPKGDQLIHFRNHQGEIANLAQHKEKKNSWQCDSLVWSVFGRYVFGSFSGKQNEEENHSVIKVWDSFSKEIVHDLSQGNNIKLRGFTFLLAPHPKREELLMSGSDFGIICLWNVQLKQLIRTFEEYGAYAFEKLLMNDPKNGKFSPDGNSFIICSEMGTLSLYGCDGDQARYQATRIEQFYQFDNEKHDRNIYYEDDALPEPQVCGFSLIPYEIQPPSSLIGKYKNYRTYSKEEYDRNFVLRVVLAKDEENFIEHTIEESKRDANFGAAYLRLGIQVEDMIQEPLDNGIGLNSQESDENDERRQQIAYPRRMNPIPRQAQQEQVPVAELRLINPYFDPENELYDRESDENFVEEGATEQVDEDESMQSVESESQEEAQFCRKKPRGVALIEDSYDEEVVRQTRATRRQQEANPRGTKRANLRDASSNGSDDGAYDLSDIENGRQTRRKTRNGGIGSKNQKLVLPSSDDESVNSDMLNEDESDFRGRNGHSKGKSKSKSRGRSNRRSNEDENARSLRSRRKNVSYKEREESYEFSNQDEPSEEQKVNRRGQKRNRQVVDSADEDMIEQPIREPIKKLKGDEDYQLLPLPLQNESPNCELCERSDGSFVGPFVSGKNRNNEERLYFHQDCLEANNHSYYDQAKQKWMNIGKAVEMSKKQPTMCDRCRNIGATITCKNCRLTFHGYYCSSLYLIPLGSPREYQCFECRNKQNFYNITDQSIEKKEVKQMKRQTSKEHLFKSQLNPKDVFIPQIDDEVYYFFQGHEKFIQTYNCFYYCGDQKTLTFKYPWKEYPSETETPTLCRVTGISFRFPSNRCMHLLKEYGQEEEIPQIPQIIIRVDLEIQIAHQEDESKQFFVEYFPSQELPEFLVLKAIFEASMSRQRSLNRDLKLIGKEFTHIQNGNKYTVKEVRPYEEIVNQSTQWLILVCNNVTEQRRQNNLQRRQDASEIIERLNVWQLNFENDRQDLMELHCLDARVREQICGVILDVTSKKEAIAAPFQNRVTAQIATDYVYLIPGEMWFSLIIERLNGNYYRSFAQVQADLELILKNCEQYNGAEHELFIAARKLIQEIKRNLKGIEPVKQEIARQGSLTLNNSVINNGSANLSNQMNVSDTKISIPMSLIQRSQQQNKAHQDQQLLHELDDGKRTSTSGRQYVEEVKSAFNPTHFPIMASSSGRNSEMQLDSGKTSSRRSTRNFQQQQQRPAQPVQESDSRRSTRRQGQNNIQKESEDLNQNHLIGKQTRSGRAAKLQKANLREPDSESEEEYQSDNEEEEEVSEEPVRGNRSKRLRRL